MRYESRKILEWQGFSEDHIIISVPLTNLVPSENRSFREVAEVPPRMLANSLVHHVHKAPGEFFNLYATDINGRGPAKQVDDCHRDLCLDK
jgi:hypothetical protein